MIHEKQSPLSSQKVRIRADALHPQVPDFGGAEYTVEDWWDRLNGKSWKEGGPIAAHIYWMRRKALNLPEDDEVLYGKIGSFGHLVHVSEIELDASETDS